MSGLSTLDWIGLVGPYAVYFVLLLGYYVVEGRRERTLRASYSEETHGE